MNITVQFSDKFNYIIAEETFSDEPLRLAFYQIVKYVGEIEKRELFDTDWKKLVITLEKV